MMSSPNMKLACGLLLATTGSGLSTASYDMDSAAAKARPVSKIVKLLKGMSDELEKEGESDQKAYDKYKCWCKVNGEEKLKLIQAANEKIPGHKARVEFLTGKMATLKTEIKKAEDEVAKNQASIDTATVLREQAKGQFDKDSTRMNDDLGAVNKAMDALSFSQEKATGFLQVPHAKDIAAKLQKVLDTNSKRLTPTTHDTLVAFLQGKSSDEVTEANSPEGILGMMKGMEDDFKSDIAQAIEKENEDIKAFTELRTAKTEEIKAGKKLIAKKKQERAEFAEENAIKKQEIKDMVGSLGDDEAFAREVVAKCEKMDKEFDERTTTRNEETEAIAKAVEILDGDDAHELFGKTLSFIQTSQQSSSGAAVVRQRLVASLTKASQKNGALMSLLLSAKLDSFTKVKKAIDDMVVALKQGSAEEVEKKEFCVNSFRKNELETDEKKADKVAVVAKVANLKASIKGEESAITALNAEVADLNKQMAQASQNREDENSEFQTVVTDQRQTAVLLKKALAVLQGFYDKGAFAQIRAHNRQSPEEPPTLGSYKNNNKSRGVMGMIQTIMAEAEAMEKEATRAEATAQEAYEAFTKDSKSALADKTKAINDKTKAKASMEKDLVESKASDEGIAEDIQDLATTDAELHASCDFLMKNFDVRQTAFEEEMDSLKQAKAILSGAKY
eukprot:TRINITY_DN5142_c3_g2_i1.p1 TRINITY_DN5142_c3_g2~~TRINITY_DN5142_c3_g2_i1.p1  ORF type:complete len:675 (-),score=226.58 TRINITY_DN5142_c3_g2_i1:136-2160(-)